MGVSGLRLDPLPRRLSHQAQTVSVARPVLTWVLFRSPPPHPTINECVRGRPPRGSLSRAQTRVARSFPCGGQRGPVTRWEIGSLSLHLQEPRPPRAISLRLRPGDPRYSGQQVSCRSGCLRHQSEQGPASRLCGTGSRGEEALRCTCLSQLGQCGRRDTLLLLVVQVTGVVRIACWRGCVSHEMTSSGTRGQTAAGA